MDASKLSEIEQTIAKAENCPWEYVQEKLGCLQRSLKRFHELKSSAKREEEWQIAEGYHYALRSGLSTYEHMKANSQSY